MPEKEEFGGHITDFSGNFPTYLNKGKPFYNLSIRTGVSKYFLVNGVEKGEGK